MKIDKYFHLYGRKDDVVFEEIPAPSAQPDIARDIATILENEQAMRVILQNAQPERKKGKWINRDFNKKCSDKETTAIFIHPNDPACSVCGKLNRHRTNFCPHCGAEMKGEEDG